MKWLLGTTQVIFDSLQKYGDSLPFLFYLWPYPLTLFFIPYSSVPIPPLPLLPFLFCFVSRFHLVWLLPMSAISLSFPYLLFIYKRNKDHIYRLEEWSLKTDLPCLHKTGIIFRSNMYSGKTHSTTWIFKDKAYTADTQFKCLSETHSA